MSIYTLAIETSCDETSAAVLQDGRTVISNVISSQVPIHRKFGGVVPEVASRHHIEQIMPVIDQALVDANMTLDDMEGHIFANFLLHPDLEPPFLCLVVSGGHTMIVHVTDYESFQVLGQTRDDAAGEAFDKIARVLGYPYPGGPHIDALAKEGNPDAIDFPRPLLEKGNFDFSFSGLKSAVLNYINGKQQKGESICHEDVAASFQKAITDVLVEKMKEAAHTLGETKIALAGGVSANSGLQRDLQAMCEAEGLTYLTAGSMLATDNAAMIGCRAYYMAQAGKFSNYTLNAKPSIPLGSDLWKGNQHD